MATSRKRNVEIEFIVDDKAATKSLRNVETQMTKTGKAFSLAGKLIASGLILDRVGDFAQQAVQSYSNLEESINAVEVTFGGAAAAIKQLGEESAESVGLSTSEFNALAVSVAGFAQNIAEASGGSVVPVIDDMTTRIADFASVMNLDLNDAAEKFRSGLAGQTEPLRAYSIDVSAAATKTYAYANGIAAAGTELSETQKQVARYGLIMQETAKFAGDFANTSDSLANRQRILAAEAENARAEVGEFLAPAFAGAADTGRDLVTILAAAADAFGQVDTEAKKNSDTMQAFVLGSLSLFIDAADKLAEKLRENEEAERELEQARLDSLAPTEAQIKAAEAADEIFFQQAETMADLAENTDDAATAQQKLTDLQKEAADPAFKLLRAIERYDDAQDDYTEAITKFGDGSEQAQEAAIDLANAQADLNEAGADFAAEGGADSIDAIEELLNRAGVLPETIEAIIDAIKEYNATPITRKEVFVPGVGNVTPGTGGIIGGDGTMIGFAEGGVVPGPKGAPVPALVHGGELVLNPEQQKALSSMRGPGPMINVYATSLSDRQLKELAEMARRQ